MRHYFLAFASILATSGAGCAGQQEPTEEVRSHQEALSSSVSPLSVNAAAPAPVVPRTAAEARDGKVTELRASGADTGNLAGYASGFSNAWAQLAKKAGVNPTFGSWECYHGGCFTNVLHDTPKGLDDLTREITRSDTFVRWRGGKMRSGPIEKAGGAVEVTWMLFPPDDGGDVFLVSKKPTQPR